MLNPKSLLWFQSSPVGVAHATLLGSLPSEQQVGERGPHRARQNGQVPRRRFCRSTSRTTDVAAGMPPLCRECARTACLPPPLRIALPAAAAATATAVPPQSCSLLYLF
eukprot:5138905-Pleurochrysis_carterae.AAC.1